MTASSDVFRPGDFSAAGTEIERDEAQEGSARLA